MQTPINKKAREIMSVRYKINSELGIAFIFCEGLFTDVEFFKVMRLMYADKSYRPEMHRLVDLFSASEDFSSLDEIRSNIKHRDKTFGENIQFGNTILLTLSKSISLFINVLDTDFKIKYSAVESLGEAISILSLQDKEQEIIDFYNQNKYQTEQAN
jgi:hypothetical protein